MSKSKSIKSGISSLKSFTKSKEDEPALVVPNSFGQTITPMPFGLAIFTNNDPSQEDEVRIAVDALILAQSDEIGIPMPKAKRLTSLYTGSPREMEQSAALLSANVEADSQVKHSTLEYPACGGIDWLGEAGQYLLADVIENNKGVVTLAQRIAGPISPSIANALHFLRAAAKENNVWLVMILTSTDGRELTNPEALCDDYIEVSSCEPDPGCDMAFSFDCVALRKLNRFGVGKTMCNLEMSLDKILHCYTPFIAADLETRAMWAMRQQKSTLDAIGRHFGGLDKSTVQRRLKGLSNHPNYKVGKGWLKRYLDSTTDGDSESEVVA